MRCSLAGCTLEKTRNGNSTASVMAEHHSGLNPVAWLAAIVEHTDDAIVSKDLNGIITSWNIGAEEIFGYKAAEMVGQSILKLIPPERHSEEDFILERVRKGERLRHYDTVRRRKDGTLVDVSLTVSPILLDGKMLEYPRSRATSPRESKGSSPRSCCSGSSITAPKICWPSLMQSCGRRRSRLHRRSWSIGSAVVFTHCP